uniref:Uncharacterized protein n=1 Tax=Sphaerodactylus townsendi TaxID=933632 RepID=A0ACB8G815_9SAUR
MWSGSSKRYVIEGRSFCTEEDEAAVQSTMKQLAVLLLLSAFLPQAKLCSQSGISSLKQDILILLAK